MNIDISLLSIQNPWWPREKDNDHFSGLKFDPIIYDYSRQKVRWLPSLVKDFDFQPGQIYLLQGPQGSGKTTALKLLIQKLVKEKKIPVEDIFYYSCFNLDTFEQLNEVIKTYLHWRGDGESRQFYIFIDKITLLKDWSAGLKHLRQAGRLKKASLVLSGYVLSGKTEAKKENPIIRQTIFSLDFLQMLSIINPELANKVNQENYSHYQKKLEYYLDVYLLTGGHIVAINSYLEHGAVSQQVYQNQLNLLIADIAKLGRDTSLVRQVLEYLVGCLGQPVGYQTIAKQTKAKTHLTIAEYLEILESLFVVKPVYQQADGEPASRKAKKFYFYDPFLFWLYYGFVHGSLNYWQFSREGLQRSDILSKIEHNAVFSHLAKFQAEVAPDIDIHYWRDNIKKQEINFVLKNKSKQLGVCVCSDFAEEQIAKKVLTENKFKQGIIISQDRHEENTSIKILPLTYFLLFYKNYLKK
jgi:predicted AAA+ superfamily ATPase